MFQTSQSFLTLLPVLTCVKKGVLGEGETRKELRMLGSSTPSPTHDEGTHLNAKACKASLCGECLQARCACTNVCATMILCAGRYECALLHIFKSWCLPR